MEAYHKETKNLLFYFSLPALLKKLQLDKTDFVPTDMNMKRIECEGQTSDPTGIPSVYVLLFIVLQMTHYIKSKCKAVPLQAM